MTGRRLTLSTLPDEIIQQVLQHVPPLNAPALQRVSRRFNDLTNEPLLWRHYCVTYFRYWDEEHGIRQKLNGYAPDVDWKQLYRHRRAVDLATRRTLDSILEKQTGRVEKYHSIVAYGYDAKDTLLEQCGVSFRTDDVLARRFAAPRDEILCCCRMLSVPAIGIIAIPCWSICTVP